MAEEGVNNGVTTVKDTPLSGKDVWYFIQSTEAKVGDPAILPAHQTDGSTSIEGDLTDEQTKMGRVLAAGTNEDSIEITNYVVPGDPSTNVMIDAKHNGKQVKVWRVQVDERLAEDEGDHKIFPAMFGYAVPESVDLSEGQDGFVEADTTLDIIGKLVDGDFPLTQEQVDILHKIYAYERPGEKTGEFTDSTETSGK